MCQKGSLSQIKGTMMELSEKIKNKDKIKLHLLPFLVETCSEGGENQLERESATSL